MYCIFPCPEAPHLRQTVTVPGLDLQLPGDQKFCIKLSPLSVGLPQRKPFLNL